jgi:hypothetical protein
MYRFILEKPMTFREAASILAALSILMLPGHTSAQTPPNCGPATDCGQRLADLANQLAKDNQALANRVSNLERELSTMHEAMRRLTERRPVLRDTGKDREFSRFTVWNSGNPYQVNYACPDRNVLVGMEFEMLNDGADRYPGRIKYICRELTP